MRGDPDAISAALTGREPPVPRGAPASRGRTHREAPERVSSVQGNPMGAADPSASPQRKPRGPRRSAGPDPDRPWGALPQVPLTGGRTEEAREGDRVDAGRCGGSGWSASKGNAPGLRSVRRPTPDQGVRASSGRASSRLPPAVPQSCGSGDPAAIDREAALPRRRGRVAARRPKAASERRENPMDGSGLSGREACGEQTVAEVRHLEDGTCRGRQPRDERIRTPMSSEGHETPGGEGPVVRPGPGTAEGRPERGPSLRERTRASAWDDLDDGTPRGRSTRRGGSGEPMTPLRRTDELREAGRPCEGCTGGGDDRPGEPRTPKSPGGTLGDLPDTTTG